MNPKSSLSSPARHPSPHRHPSERWDRSRKSALLVGTLALALGLSACTKIEDDAPAVPPAGGGGGPPPMPEPITLADRPDATGGEALYIVKCMVCHGPNGMGEGLLGRRSDIANLEARDDLVAEFVVQAARMGIANMPAIPRGEVSDDEMQQIAEYLAAGPHVEQPAPAGPPPAPAEGEES